MKSAHASLVARLEGSTGGDPEAQTAAEERMLLAAARGRSISEALHRTSHETQRVLAAFYRPDKLSSYWHELTHLLEMTGLYNRGLHGPLDGGIGLRMILKNAKPEQLQAAMKLRRAAEVLASRAHEEFALVEASRPTRGGA